MIKAIPTIYNGVEYRSRLEAQVACLLTNLGADFQYEPQGFDLGDGLKYLPDFFVTNNCAYENPSEHRIEKGAYKGEICPKQFWIEVKGNFSNKERDEEKVLKFANKMEVGKVLNYAPAIFEPWGGTEFESESESDFMLDFQIIENPILIIDEMPPENVLHSFDALNYWCIKKSQEEAVGAKEIKPFSFEWLQDYCLESSFEIDYFTNSAPCPCINKDGTFWIAPPFFWDAGIDAERTLDAYKKALEVGKWSPRRA